MSCSKYLLQVFGTMVVVVFLLGCNMPAITSSLVPTPATSVEPGMLNSQPTLFKFIHTVQVTPDDQYLTGAFSRINYVPATDRFLVTFGGTLAEPSAGCPGKSFSYKFYTMDMQETGESGTFACDIADAASVMVNNTYYYAAMARRGEQVGWHLLKIDAAGWETSVDTFFPLDYPLEYDNDPMVVFVNGQIDISSGHMPLGHPPDPILTPQGYGTHHQFFSTEFQFQNKRVLTDLPHIHGSSMTYVNGLYYFVTADNYAGDVIVMRYDGDWNYLGAKTLIKQAQFPTGLVFDGQQIYLAYADTSQRSNPTFFPVFLNIRLSAFDRDWNLLENVAVTSYIPQDNMQPGRPWVIQHGNRLYVSYDIDPTDSFNHEELLKWQAYVSIYELAH